ncbi:hypothetical protein [Sphingosinicella sp. BN140058]|uniref:hypothetical protein n=1 Tax=Sphingosinicella sp. BN140058 TaxID=1892855 RepID=UPI0013ED23FE|nr:hypothetical protein [Sphingosinicella sp. BN140058]
MKRLTDEIIDALGGLTAISRLVRAPVSTVSSWKTRISDARLHHLALAAQHAGIEVDWASIAGADILADPAASATNGIANIPCETEQEAAAA